MFKYILIDKDKIVHEFNVNGWKNAYVEKEIFDREHGCSTELFVRVKTQEEIEAENVQQH